jgi:ElaB/YqjD/DUF883 family membrane-anchored ribosome-binding protein
MSSEDTGARHHHVASETLSSLESSARDLEDRFAPKFEEAKEQLALVNNRVKGFIRENPGTSLLCALGIGYLIGKLASRK